MRERREREKGEREGKREGREGRGRERETALLACHLPVHIIHVTLQLPPLGCPLPHPPFPPNPNADRPSPSRFGERCLCVLCGGRAGGSGGFGQCEGGESRDPIGEAVRRSVAAVEAAGMEAVAEFEWIPGVTPLSDVRKAVAIVAQYLVAVWLLTKVPKSIKAGVVAAPAFRGFVALHSIGLCVGSLAMFVGGIVAYYKVRHVRIASHARMRQSDALPRPIAGSRRRRVLGLADVQDR